MKIAVIGAGIFGCDLAIQLSESGLNVTLYESESEILRGATANSQNRLHLGLHYPRDLETARQSVNGFTGFRERYYESIDTSFANYYALAASGSKVSVSEFEEFSRRAGINIRKLDSDVLPQGIKIKGTSSIYESGEGVIDMEILKILLDSKIEKARVNLKLNHAVTKMAHTKKKWEVFVDKEYDDSYDFIVKCTYSSDSIDVEAENYKTREIEFHQTLIQVIDSDAERFGLTIVDGDFLTILPRGKTSTYLAYGPSISTVRKEKSKSVPLEWEKFDLDTISDFKKQIAKRIDFWIENWNYEFATEYLETIRTIEPNVESTDRRTSRVIESAPNFFEIWSGKIDHCIETSSIVLNHIINSM